MEPKNISKHCINYGRDNHNVETCRVKKKEPIVTTTKAIIHNQKLQKTASCACHICDMDGHKIIDYPKIVKM
jgi:hypothetical protein